MIGVSLRFTHSPNAGPTTGATIAPVVISTFLLFTHDVAVFVTVQFMVITSPAVRLLIIILEFVLTPIVIAVPPVCVQMPVSPALSAASIVYVSLQMVMSFPGLTTGNSFILIGVVYVLVQPSSSTIQVMSISSGNTVILLTIIPLLAVFTGLEKLTMAAPLFIVADQTPGSPL